MSSDRYDAVVLGGGLAGQTVARQLLLQDPDIRLMVVERRQHPVAEAAFKVGESTVEIATHYLAETLRLRPHLDSEQLPKLGLRFFLSQGDNSDISSRVEVGGSFFPKVPSYQIDRGRFENYLGRENEALGAKFIDGCSVSRVDVASDDEDHRIELVKDGVRSEVASRWIIDASGRAGILKNKLDLGQPVNHHACAVWFRIEDRLDVNQWSDDDTWRQRVPDDPRYLSTNHLMGHGYWVWLIPLASGATSVGIVFDPDIHPVKTLNRFPKAMKWLEKYEPQCAAEIEKRSDRVLDFRSIRHFAHGCRQLYSADRWGITGEAGVFNDPFYSPGSDLISMSNSFITDLVLRERRGEDIADRASQYDRILRGVFESSLLTYDGQYPAMGNARVTAAKLIWDNGTYWGILALLFFHDKLRDLDFMQAIGGEMWRFNQLNARMQKLFIDWDKGYNAEHKEFFLDFLGMRFMFDLQKQLDDRLDEEALTARIKHNLDIFETLATGMFRQAAQDLELPLGDREIDPKAIGLDPESWGKDGLFDVSPGPAPGPEIDFRSLWFEVPLSASAHLAPSESPVESNALG